MKILIASLLKRKVTQDILASRPHIIYQLAYGLTRLGHNVTMIGTGDSVIPGVKIIPVISKAFSYLPAFENSFYAETAYLTQMSKTIETIGNNFDVIHNHTYPEFINLFAAKSLKTPFVTTIHAQATEELDVTLSLFPETSFVALAKAHKNLFHKTRIDYVVYNGVDTNFFVDNGNIDTLGSYFLFVGRMSKAKSNGEFLDPKGVSHAITLAKKSNLHLKIVGNVEDKDFYTQCIKPHLSSSIEFIGEVSAEPTVTREQMRSLYQHAKALIFPILWEEPFGLVMIEAMACGTPVIAYNRGSVSEILRDGMTGFIIDPDEGIEGLAKAAKRIGEIDRSACRRHIEENFTVEKMVNEYEAVFATSIRTVL